MSRFFSGVSGCAMLAASLPSVSFLANGALADVQPTAALPDEQQQPAATLPPVVVSATRIPTPEDEVASSVTVITAEDIQAKQFQTLPDALNDVPGLNVVQTGGPGGQTSVFIRGTNSNHTKILIDGIDVSDPSTPNGTFDLGNLLLADVDRIEVLRGPQSGVYGSDALGGVISITTKNGDGPLRLTGSLEGGSFDTVNESGGASGSAGWLSYAFNVAHFSAGDTAVTPVDQLPPGQILNDDSDNNTTLSTKLGAKVTDEFELGLAARYTETKLRFTGTGDNAAFLEVPDASQSEEDTRQLYTRGFGHLVSFDGRLDQSLGFAYTENRTDDLAPLNPNDNTLGQRVKVDYLGMVRVTPDEIFSFGAEHFTDSIENSPISAETTTNAGFGQLQSSIDGKFFNAANIRYDTNDRFGDIVTYREAPEYRILDTDTILRGSVGTGFKAPSLEDLFVSFPAFDFFANPNLRPESSIGYDLGFEQALLAKHLHFGATYFHNDIRNLIETNATGTTEINIDRAVTQGVESFVAFDPTDRLSLQADYTYTLTRDDMDSMELLRRPKDKASLNGSYQASDALSFNSTLVYIGPFLDVNRAGTASGVTANGFVTVNVESNYDLNEHWALFARIENLFDRHYQDPIGFMHPGIGAFGGVRAIF
jgi:vitamin B12 transporter